MTRPGERLAAERWVAADCGLMTRPGERLAAERREAGGRLMTQPSERLAAERRESAGGRLMTRPGGRLAGGRLAGGGGYRGALRRAAWVLAASPSVGGVRQAVVASCFSPADIFLQ
jgi:hypothetical protein